MNTKQCPKCKKDLPATNEYFSTQKRGLYGLASQCKQCDKAYRESMKNPIVYRVTHIESGKMYVGQTIKPLAWRVSHHFSSAKTPKSPFHEFISENNFDKSLFTYEVLQESYSKDDLDEIERLWIDRLKDDGAYLFNLQDGGVNGYKADGSTKEKISGKHKGKTLTPEHAQKIVETKKRNGTFGVGYKHTEETKAKMSEARRNSPSIVPTVGSKNGNAKLSEKMVLSIIEFLIEGRKPKEIESLTGVSISLISNINVRKSWKHVTAKGYEDVSSYQQRRKRM